jgi:hypothetical protein
VRFLQAYKLSVFYRSVTIFAVSLFSFFFSGVVVFIPQAPFTQPHIVLFKQMPSFLRAIALSEKNETFGKNHARPVACEKQPQTVIFYSFIRLSEENPQRIYSLYGFDTSVAIFDSEQRMF